MKHQSSLLTIAVSLTLAGAASAQTTGPSTNQVPYLLPVAPGVSVTSILSVGNAQSPSFLVPRTGTTTGQTYELAGIPDGLGAYDNNNGTFTLLVNHEFGWVLPRLDVATASKILGINDKQIYFQCTTFGA